MKLIIYLISFFLVISCSLTAQSTEINKTDAQGKKQGFWTKKYPGGTVQYEGTFRDDHPVGEFKRYYENKILKSVLIYSVDGEEADATFYYPNGYISLTGKYIHQLKEGKWKFFSEINSGYLVSEEEYSKDLLNGTSVKYFLNGNIAERLTYVNGAKNGECVQFYESGKNFLKTYYKNGVLDGSLEVWFENGQPKFTGFYRNNIRDGKWVIHNEDGSLKYEVKYKDGVTSDNPMEAEAAAFMESLEKNKDNVVDPEKNR